MFVISCLRIASIRSCLCLPFGVAVNVSLVFKFFNTSVNARCFRVARGYIYASASSIMVCNSSRGNDNGLSISSLENVNITLVKISASNS